MMTTLPMRFAVGLYLAFVALSIPCHKTVQ